MENIAGATAQAPTATEAANGTADAQLMRRHFERRNAGLTEAGVAVSADQQFQRDVLNGMGIGNKVDATV